MKISMTSDNAYILFQLFLIISCLFFIAESAKSDQ